MKANKNSDYEVKPGEEKHWHVIVEVSNDDPIARTYQKRDELIHFKARQDWLNFKKIIEDGAHPNIRGGIVNAVTLIHDPELKTEEIPEEIIQDEIPEKEKRPRGNPKLKSKVE